MAESPVQHASANAAVPWSSARERVLRRERRDQQLADLLSRSAQGHEEAFAEFYDLTVAPLYGTVLAVLGCPEHAREVTKAAYVQVWREAARYRPDHGDPYAWIAAIAHRRAVQRVREVRRAAARTGAR